MDLFPGPARTMLLLLVTCGLAAACTARATASRPTEAIAPPPPWQSKFGVDRPLVGRIWDVGAERFIDPPTLAARLALARFVLLGERHDNPDHHRLQAWVLRALVDEGRRPAVGFEMLTEDQAPALARYLGSSPQDGAGLGDAVGWNKTGWPEWATYRPIADVALGAGLTIVATDVGRAGMQAMRKDGVTAVPAALVSRYALDRPPTTDDEASMAAEIRESHCNQAPESIIPKMIFMQRARDAHMAETLEAAAARDGAVLIAGSGHTRKDWGVPAYLRQRAPGASIASVAFLEALEGHAAPAGYAEGFHARSLPFDYVWFTPRVDDEDPCEKFKPSLERLRKQP
jgi:uncharacterized iron-regulated protein